MKRPIPTRIDRYPARRQRKEKATMPDPQANPTSETPQSPQPAPPPKVELAQENYERGQVLDLQPDFEAAKAVFAAAVPIAEEGIPRRKAWLAAPVTPRPNRFGELVAPFETFPSVAELLRQAKPQHCPQFPFWGEFVDWRAKVEGFAQEIVDAEQALARLATLQAKDCQRDPAFRSLRRWPQDSLVDRLHTAMIRMGTGDDLFTDAAHELAVALTRLLNWSRTVRAQGTPLSATTRPPQEPPESEGRQAIVGFNPLDYPRY